MRRRCAKESEREWDMEDDEGQNTQTKKPLIRRQSQGDEKGSWRRIIIIIKASCVFKLNPLNRHTSSPRTPHLQCYYTTTNSPTSSQTQKKNWSLYITLKHRCRPTCPKREKIGHRRVVGGCGCCAHRCCRCCYGLMWRKMMLMTGIGTGHHNIKGLYFYISLLFFHMHLLNEEWPIVRNIQVLCTPL